MIGRALNLLLAVRAGATARASCLLAAAAMLCGCAALWPSAAAASCQNLDNANQSFSGTAGASWDSGTITDHDGDTASIQRSATGLSLTDIAYNARIGGYTSTSNATGGSVTFDDAASFTGEPYDGTSTETGSGPAIAPPSDAPNYINPQIEFDYTNCTYQLTFSFVGAADQVQLAPGDPQQVASDPFAEVIVRTPSMPIPADLALQGSSQVPVLTAGSFNDQPEQDQGQGLLWPTDNDGFVGAFNSIAGTPPTTPTYPAPGTTSVTWSLTPSASGSSGGGNGGGKGGSPGGGGGSNPTSGAGGGSSGGGTSTHAKRCVVPRVIGLTEQAAATKLERAGCALGRVSKRTSSNVAKGKVISSQPKAGTTHPLHMKVALVISSGPKR